ncbi:N-sulphoglucosamine sulphohydrolase-like [Diadema setosum]|uniref:N-sulphoglucosamine sulphohydrolase-like n=1 Tax=Diadema setosum TaxID=31175 RepID=UPI003B39FDAC
MSSDDDGFEKGAYNNTVCKTPNFDRLAERGLILTRGYASTSTCSPSRAAILSGLPQHQNGQYGLANSAYHFRSFETVRSIPTILSGHGIYTGIVGKKHIGPDSVYKFDFEETELNNDELQISRNITLMKGFVQDFLAKTQSRPFFLYVGLKDPHRAQDKDVDRYGLFSEKFGNGEEGMGVIPDWTPFHYSPHEVIVPAYLPDNLVTRQDIAAQYTSMSRLDAGIGMLLRELERTGHLDDTLIIYSGDNGIPFPNAKTTLYEMGIREPMLISSPDHPHSWGHTSPAFVNTLDFFPTILDWFGVPFESYNIFPNQPVCLTGKSIIPLLEKDEETETERWQQTFASQSLHEITMYYPMRTIRRRNFHLIHNLNRREYFPVATDIAGSPTFQQILKDTERGARTGWFKSLEDFYYRPEWELYDVENDPLEVHNLAESHSHAKILQEMKVSLKVWQNETFDPWICQPNAVLFGGQFCLPILNQKTNSQNSRSREDL